MLKAEGINAGLIRPKTLWPFPSKAFDKLGDNVKHVISVELSQGQMINDVKLAVCGKYPVDLINRVGGMLLSPAEVAERAKTIIGGNR
jgi:2-oxoglutarate ferredoxin oxidoreductase subunit alpha